MFEQITLDHSLLQELVDRGFYSEEEAQRSTNRNYVTRALGVEPTVEVEVHEYEVLPDDIYVLCSDGLPDMVEDEDIHLTISTFNASLDVVGQQLIDLANDHGGRDNVSVMLAQVSRAVCSEESHCWRKLPAGFVRRGLQGFKSENYGTVNSESGQSGPG